MIRKSMLRPINYDGDGHDNDSYCEGNGDIDVWEARVRTIIKDSLSVWVREDESGWKVTGYDH